jgi:hypothetical protein
VFFDFIYLIESLAIGVLVYYVLCSISICSLHWEDFFDRLA